jgi:hypothetical protein
LLPAQTTRSQSLPRLLPVRVAESFVVRSSTRKNDASKVERFGPRSTKPHFSFHAPRAMLPVALPAPLLIIQNELDFDRLGEETPVQRLARARYQLRTHPCEPERGQVLSQQQRPVLGRVARVVVVVVTLIVTAFAGYGGYLTYTRRGFADYYESRGKEYFFQVRYHRNCVTADQWR